MRKFVIVIAAVLAVLAAWRVYLDFASPSRNADAPALTANDAAQAHCPADKTRHLLKEKAVPAIRAEMAAKDLPAAGFAVFDRGGIIWSAAFGDLAAGAHGPPTVDSVFRAGSITKLFTYVAVMRHVERGEIDLDAPIETYLPEFAPENAFGAPITVRRLMTHQAGLVREPPVGHYFDDSAPSLEDTVLSLNETAVLMRPGEGTKYSNAGVAVLGLLLERLNGRSFEEIIEGAILSPIGMSRSALSLNDAASGALVRGRMRSIGNVPFDAPVFDFGMAPAANLYTSVADLSAFGVMLLNGGETSDGGKVISSVSLQAMWEPQPDETGFDRFGLGFLLGETASKRTVGHTGVVYGYGAALKLFPDDGLGFVAMGAIDASTATLRKLIAYAETLVLGCGDAVDAHRVSDVVDAETARAAAGLYVDGDDRAHLRVRGDRLYFEGPGLLSSEVRRLGDQWLLEDVQHFETDFDLDLEAGTLRLGEKAFHKVEWPEPEPFDGQYADLVGAYGWAHNYIRLYEWNGALYALIEWFDKAPLTEVEPDVFALPTDSSFYRLEKIRVHRDDAGRPDRLLLSGIGFPRRDFGAEAQARLRAELKLPENLREEARAAAPPEEEGEFKTPDLVAADAFDETIKLDVRYASENNFAGVRIYDEPRALLQREAAEGLTRANAALRAHGYGLLVLDAYRPWFVTRMFWDMAPDDKKVFVADPAKGSRHNRGCAVDVTLYDLETGEEAEMTGRYDEGSDRSMPLYLGGTELQRWRRDLLLRVMEENGFRVYDYEWWHFDCKNWRNYPILNAAFSEIGKEMP